MGSPKSAIIPETYRTKGLEVGMPGFHKFTKKRLRTAEEGADTIVWLLLTSKTIDSGGFYFDRKKVSPYMSSKYIPTGRQRESLMKLLDTSYASL